MEIESIVVGSLNTNCYLLVSENEILIIDPGQESDRILEKIKEKNKKVKKIILTHYHQDHTQEAQKIKVALNAQILAHRKDVSFLNFNEVGVDQVLKDQEIIEFNNHQLKVIHTPGHTEGSICLLGDNFIITGDTLFQEGHGRIDLPGGSCREIKKSLDKIKELVEPGMIVYPGHGEKFKFS
jgi:hydroxyacylglutathione hydrolase